MKITILNGNPEAGDSPFDRYVDKLVTALSVENHAVENLKLRDMEIKTCTGCFGCWVKTPGECIVPDDSHEVCRAMINSDFLLWAAPMRMGFPSALLKKMMDKSIPLIHPYFVVDHGEAHHRPRYEHYPRIGLLLEGEAGTDDADLALVSDIFSRTALNMKSRLEFVYTTDTQIQDVVLAISSDSDKEVLFARNLGGIPGYSHSKPQHLTLFNGSPRGPKGNTPQMLEQVMHGFTADGSHTAEMHHLAQRAKHDHHVQAFTNAEAVVLGFPLYTDAMPGLVKEFIEALAPLLKKNKQVPMGFLVQSGFPESTHSRHVERYLEKLTSRFGGSYMGTIVKGGCEGVHLMPENMNKKLFEKLTNAGKALAEKGHVDILTLNDLAKPERYPAYLVPVFKLLARTPFLSTYWNSQLKRNGVYEQRFAQPFVESVK